MDKTEIYIKMCDCPEIQEYRKKPKSFQVGDFMANYYLGENSKAILDEALVFEITHHIKNRMLVIWLPRQDQIQEMFYKNFEEQGLSLVDKLCLFCFSFIKNDALEFPKWLSDEYGEYKLSSFEQLWLAFYMCEKHSKVWSSKEEKWVKK